MRFLILLVAIICLLPVSAYADTANRLAGKILLQVEEAGEAWYVNPVSKERYFLGRPADAFAVMRALGLGVSNADLNVIPTSADSFPGNQALRERLRGRILLQVEGNGEAWYINPGDLKRYYLGRPADAFAVMRELGLGITNNDLNTIAIAQDSASSIIDTHASDSENNNVDAPAEDTGAETVRYHWLEDRQIRINLEEFPVKLITINRAMPGLTVNSSTAYQEDCRQDCAAETMDEHIAKFTKPLVAIHGAYFCPPDYSQCINEINATFWPFYNTPTGHFINEERMKWTEGPMIIFDRLNRPYFYKRTAQIYTPENFTAAHGHIQAAISNGPALIEDGEIIWEDDPVDNKQKFTKAIRGGFGYNDDFFFILVAQNATVPDLAKLFSKIGAQYALNLDGGGSTALWYDGEYIMGPGRDLPTAMIFSVKE